MKYFIYIYFFLKGIYHTNSWDFKYVSCRWGIFLEEELDHLCKDSWDLQVFWDSSTLGKQVCLNKKNFVCSLFPWIWCKKTAAGVLWSAEQCKGQRPWAWYYTRCQHTCATKYFIKNHLAGDPYIQKANDPSLDFVPYKISTMSSLQFFTLTLYQVRPTFIAIYLVSDLKTMNSNCCVLGLQTHW